MHGTTELLLYKNSYHTIEHYLPGSHINMFLYCWIILFFFTSTLWWYFCHSKMCPMLLNIKALGKLRLCCLLWWNPNYLPFLLNLFQTHIHRGSGDKHTVSLLRLPTVVREEVPGSDAGVPDQSESTDVTLRHLRHHAGPSELSRRRRSQGKSRRARY